jgi:hypothetical protein
MSFPPATEMFQFAGFASHAYVFSVRSPCGGVAPFGYPRINDRSHLPAAFRSVLRPSSPLGAKASTKCPSTLDLYLSSEPLKFLRTGTAHLYFSSRSSLGSRRRMRALTTPFRSAFDRNPDHRHAVPKS